MFNSEQINLLSAEDSRWLWVVTWSQKM